MICLELSQRPFLLKDHWLSNQLYINNTSNAGNLTYKILFQGVTFLEKNLYVFIQHLLNICYMSNTVLATGDTVVKKVDPLSMVCKIP